MDILFLSKQEFKKRLLSHIETVYGKEVSEYIAQKILDIFVDIQPASKKTYKSPEFNQINEGWSQKDIYLITYANSIRSEIDVPLKALYFFLMKYLKGLVNTVHILPFFPYSSDDGFAVIDYTSVNTEYGDWQDIQNISQQFDLMVDLVINHISSKSEWFQQFINFEKPGCDYFIEVQDTQGLSDVVRPRASSLLQEVKTVQGSKKVWCTFSPDQVDVNFANPDVLLEFLKILKFYLQQGARIIRLDAIAFLWKKIGTTCINLPETHEIIKIFRLIVERYYPRVIFITETNVPNLENLKYFGNSNEAHAIYNFSLPPLLLHAMWAGISSNLVRWSMSLPPAPINCTYLNFTASHDGIGLRPIEGILSDDVTEALVKGMQDFGGQVTTRSIGVNGERPYEINITWMDAMQGTSSGKDNFQIIRFICSQTIMLGLEGIPAFYIHSLLAGENDYEKFAQTKHKRSINRGQWRLDQVDELLNDSTSKTYKVFHELKRLILIRSKQAAFHPSATQFTLHLGSKIFGFWRQSINREQSIFAIHNVTNAEQELLLSNINLICTDTWVDLIAHSTIDLGSETVQLKPYQCMWITNKA